MCASVSEGNEASDCEPSWIMTVATVNGVMCGKSSATMPIAMLVVPNKNRMAFSSTSAAIGIHFSAALHFLGNTTMTGL